MERDILIGYMSGIIISVLIFILFIIGLWNSKIHSFKPGIYFFLLLIIHEIYSWISPPFIRNCIDTLISEHKDPILGMTIGEFVAFLSLIPKMIILAAFICLIFGLRRLWKLKG